MVLNSTGETAMSHYTVKFVGSRAEKERAALAECFSYLSKKQRDAIKTAAMSCNSVRGCYRMARFCCAFTGIREYYPVRALARFMIQTRFPSAFPLKD